MTEEEIKKAVNEVFNEALCKTPERKIKVWRYCLTAGGLICYSAPFSNICSNKECVNCQQMHRHFKNEVENQLKTI